jgi:hypothetical protein
MSVVVSAFYQVFAGVPGIKARYGGRAVCMEDQKHLLSPGVFAQLPTGGFRNKYGGGLTDQGKLV